jgi:hypothetical protein
VNLTLTADEALIAKARDYAQARNTTLNQLVRDYLERITGRIDGPEAAEEFARIASEHAGCSDADFHFDREAVHRRGNAP